MDGSEPQISIPGACCPTSSRSFRNCSRSCTALMLALLADLLKQLFSFPSSTAYGLPAAFADTYCRKNSALEWSQTAFFGSSTCAWRPNFPLRP